MAKKKIEKVVEVPGESKSERDDRATDLVVDSQKDSLDFYDEKFRQFNYFDRLYQKGAAKKNTPYGRANLELPLGFQQIEPFVSQMTETMVGEAPYLAYEGRLKEDDETAEHITDFTSWQIDEGGFLTAYTQWLRNLGKYGTAIMKVPWETKTIYDVEDEDEKEIPIKGPDGQPVIDPQTGAPKTKIVLVKTKEDVKLHEGPRFYNLPIFDFFVPRSATSVNIQELDWCIHRSYRDLEDLLLNPNYSRAHKKIKALMNKEDDDGDNDSDSGEEPKLSARDQAKRVSEEQKNPNKAMRKYNGKVEVLEWWGNFSWKRGEPSKPTLIVVGLVDGDPLLLRLDVNPNKFKFKPFLASNDYPIEGEFYGYGELHHIKGLIEESTALRNARLDVANISLNRVWLVERAAGVNLRELYTAPNKVILTNDLNGLKAMDMGNVTPSSVNELARIDYDIQNTTEIVNPRQDASQQGAAFGQTATGVNFLSSKSNLRLLTKARLMEETFFKPLAQMLNWYNKHLVTDEVFFRVTGEENAYKQASIGPDAFDTQVDFKPTSNPQKLSIAQRKDNLGYLLQNVMQIEKVKPGTNNLFELMKIVYKLSGFPHPDKYVNPPQTTIMMTAQNQPVDQQGQPVNIIQLGPDGKPVQQDPSGQPPPQQ